MPSVRSELILWWNETVVSWEVLGRNPVVHYDLSWELVRFNYDLTPHYYLSFMLALDGTRFIRHPDADGHLSWKERYIGTDVPIGLTNGAPTDSE